VCKEGAALDRAYGRQVQGVVIPAAQIALRRYLLTHPVLAVERDGRKIALDLPRARCSARMPCLSLGKAADSLALRLEPKPGCALFLRAHAEVCDDGMHGPMEQVKGAVTKMRRKVEAWLVEDEPRNCFLGSTAIWYLKPRWSNGRRSKLAPQLCA
jgi:hypothetical protein